MDTDQRNQITVMVADVEGSTALIAREGEEAARAVIDAVRAIIRTVLHERDGHEEDAIGDELMATFPSASAGVAAAVDIHTRLAAPGGAGVRVRIGLEAGAVPRRADGHAHGAVVHRAARLCALGDGGAVVAGPRARDLAGDARGASWRDEGRMVLKGFGEPVAVSSLAWDGPQTPGLRPRPSRTRRALLAGSTLIAVGAFAAVAGVVLSQPAAHPPRLTGPAVGLLDARSGRILGQTRLTASPGGIAADARGLWVATPDARTVLRVDRASRQVSATLATGRVTGVAVGAGSLWTYGPGGVLRRLDPQFGTVTASYRLHPPPAPGASWPDLLSFTGGSVLAGAGADRVVRIGPATGRRTATGGTFSSPSAVLSAGGATWIADGGEDVVVRIDGRGRVRRIRVGQGPQALAGDARAVWVANAVDDTVMRIDPRSGRVVATIPVPGAPSALALAGGGLWVAQRLAGRIARIDPSTNRLLRSVDVGASPTALGSAGAALWVAADPAPPHSGTGTILIAAQDDYYDTDPALAYSPIGFQVYDATCTKLMSYPDRLAPHGQIPQPDVAAGPPQVSDGGRTYTFRIAHGWRFSPPSTEIVTARTFQHVFERLLAPRVSNTSLIQYYGDIAGAAAYHVGRARRITGITAAGDRLTIRLTRPAGDFLVRLALSFTCAVPVNTPRPAGPNALPALPSAGPYMVTQYLPGQRLLLEPNPHYRGGRPRRLARIEYVFGGGPGSAVAQIRRGTLDASVDAVPARDVPALEHEYGARRGAARRLFRWPELLVRYLALNMSRPALRDVHLREAVNEAIDRPALARAEATSSGGALLPTDRYLPPGVPGYEHGHRFPLTGPDLPRARALVAGRHPRVILMTCRDPRCLQVARIVTRDLGAAGFHVRAESLPESQFLRVFSEPARAFDLLYTGWGLDYPDAQNMLDPLFNGRHIESGGVNDPRIDDPRVNRELDAAASVRGPARARAYAAIEQDLLRRVVPLAAIAVPQTVAFFSDRVGCQLYRPDLASFDLVTLCRRR
jgi:peptide/nickel transport system substrate-binding protein